MITSIIPPLSGLAGVSQSTLDIKEGNRSVQKILPVLKANHLEPSLPEDYQAWVRARQSLAKILKKEGVRCG